MNFFGVYNLQDFRFYRFLVVVCLLACHLFIENEKN